MHTDTTATPGDDLWDLAGQRADLQQLPTDDRATPDALIDLLAVANQLRAEADTMAVRLSARLADLGLVARSCRICGQLFADRAGRRPRLYCRVQCELDSQTLAYRQRTDEVSATGTAGG